MEEVLDVYKRLYNPKIPVVGMDETPRQSPKRLARLFSEKKGTSGTSRL
jgi:hypothetical protein